MKVLAFYLPQFHRVKENDEWWGEGYTEWTAVRGAEKLFAEHYQPHVPLDNFYYDLLDKHTMLWQAELMKKYNVYGMCFYHYYFADERKILEKPAENLLKWNDIDMPFCFSWANETWARTWSKVGSVNSWNTVCEKKRDTSDGILLKQEYGGEKEWKKHFEYLLPFFDDRRYIRIEGKPLFIIHKASDISCLTRMMDYWNELAIEYGLSGIFFMASNSEIKGVNGYLQQEANYSDVGFDTKIRDYDEICNKIVSNAINANENCYLCGFPGYDDTPRRGKAGEVVVNSTPDKFKNLMIRLMYLSDSRGLEYIFVNAWNEWGEGMHLEPDEKYGYGYLEALKQALDEYSFLENETKQLLKQADIKNDNALCEKYKTYMNLYEKWLRIKEKGLSIKSFFAKYSYNDVALYGMGMVSKHIMEELKESGINIVCGIDRNYKNGWDIPIYTPDSIVDDVDVIVVTTIYDYYTIRQSLKKKTHVTILSFGEIIDEVLG